MKTLDVSKGASKGDILEYEGAVIDSKGALFKGPPHYRIAAEDVGFVMASS